MKKSLCIIFLFIGISLSAQDISLKTNLLYDISTTFNLGAEFRLAPKWTLDVSANYNPFTFSDSKKWKHWMAQPEARYWLCEAFNGHFFGLHLLGGQFNVGNVKFPLLRRRLVLRLSVDIGQPLEPGSEHRCRLRAEPLR